MVLPGMGLRPPSLTQQQVRGCAGRAGRAGVGCGVLGWDGRPWRTSRRRPLTREGTPVGCFAQAASTALEPEVIELVHYFKIGERRCGSTRAFFLSSLLSSFPLCLGTRGC